MGELLKQCIALLPSLWRYRQRPRLHLYFDAANTYHLRSVTDAGGVPGYFCHVMVRNDGPTPARNCRGELMEVLQRNPEGSTSPAPGFVASVSLKWAHEPDFGPRDIEHELPRRLDLCYALASSPQILRFFAPPNPSGVQKIFPPGVYIVVVRLTADNARTARGVFRVDFTQGWNRIVVVEAASA